MTKQTLGLVRHIRPRFVDWWASATVISAFAIGVVLLAWNAHTLRLDLNGTDMSWIVLVAFGTTWRGDWAAGWRVAGGLALGCVVAIPAFFFSLATLPVTPLAIALALGVSAALMGVASHAVPRIISFSGAAIGFGVGIAVARSFGIQPSIVIGDVAALMLTALTGVAIGVFASMALRAVVLRAGMRGRGEGHVVHLPRRARGRLGDGAGAADPAAAPAKRRARG